jgi:putative FmdB family regulatory protein
MPLYEYQCEKCGDLFEVMQKFADEPLKVHEKCGGPVHRLLSAPALQFKGSGWYITDYARGGSGKGAESGNGKSPGESSAAKSTGDSSVTKSDSPATSSTPSSSSSDRK